MLVLASLLSLVAQAPPPTREDPFARLGLEADLRATASGWRRPSLRSNEVAAPALAQRILEAPAVGSAKAEDFVRDALAEIRAVPLLHAAAAALGGGRREPEGKLPAAMDARRFEATLERAHREVVRALGSGRDPALLAPVLQAAIERYMVAGALDKMAEDERASLHTVLARAAKVDHAALLQQAVVMVQAAQALVADAAPSLARAPTKPGERGVTGGVVLDRATPFGRFVIGGTGHNEYECGDIAVIVDLGGDDEYRGPVAGTGVSRRLSLVVDLAGDDSYLGQNDALGSAVFGVGILLDLAGNDHYEGLARCAGFGAAGVGVLIDGAGDDDSTFAGDSGGVGLLGVGLCLDSGAGKDITRAGPRSLGVGLPGGVGFFVDDGGDDVRSLRGSDGASPLACGVGLGVSRWLAGGLGVFVDVGGADQYETGDRSCGAGIDGGVGVCFDAAGRDRYMVGDTCLGAGWGHGVGVFVDAAGDDEYHARGVSLGCAFDHSVGWAEDRSGHDVYDLRGSWPGFADGGALGAFFDLADDDRYTLTVQPVVWLADVADRSIALGVFEDRGSAGDLYQADGVVRSPCHGVVDRQNVKGAAGEVVRVLASH